MVSSLSFDMFVTGWFETKKYSLEVSYTTRPPLGVYKGGIQGEISNLCKTSFSDP